MGYLGLASGTQRGRPSRIWALGFCQSTFSVSSHVLEWLGHGLYIYFLTFSIKLRTNWTVARRKRKAIRPAPHFGRQKRKAIQPARPELASAAPIRDASHPAPSKVRQSCERPAQQTGSLKEKLMCLLASSPCDILLPRKATGLASRASTSPHNVTPRAAINHQRN